MYENVKRNLPETNRLIARKQPLYGKLDLSVRRQHHQIFLLWIVRSPQNSAGKKNAKIFFPSPISKFWMSATDDYICSAPSMVLAKQRTSSGLTMLRITGECVAKRICAS